MRKEQGQDKDLTITLGHDEIVIHHRYEVLSIANDVLIGIWFVIGSICFFFKGSVQEIGVWLFLLGSVQLLIRPMIRLHRLIQMKNLPSSSSDF
ncbi:YrhK family protein [Halomonas sp. WWR20]